MPKIIDHDERRREIVAVARRLILRGGFHAATMRSIAAEAGFANGALKHYFASKEAIVVATFESIIGEMTAAMRAPDSPDEVDPLHRFLHVPLPATAQQVATGRVLLALWEYAMTNAEVAQVYGRFLDFWRGSCVERLQSARAVGDITADPPYDVVVDEYMTVVIGAVIVNLMHPHGERVERYHAYVDALLTRLR
ncbi:TetR/AcrR family transcriptional regulator [Xylanimonas ulmi]|uniref:TetR family transcriptional regulator n=1 Tax=Xylanimonas ulmi TaxID=228973 RepID=A0A4Q7M1Z3_9MICO|nr:TetR/AcrR family transcriptional regulator [Xylanibacterium ulmi]RZS61876.1 TetR family transcriptional regulator [Xylanibacterium ulmi]